MSNQNQTRPKRVICCPHCRTVLPEGAELCCQALKDELNALATAQGSDIMKLQVAFERWFQDHKIEEGTL